MHPPSLPPTEDDEGPPVDDDEGPPDDDDEGPPDDDDEGPPDDDDEGLLPHAPPRRGNQYGKVVADEILKPILDIMINERGMQSKHIVAELLSQHGITLGMRTLKRRLQAFGFARSRLNEPPIGDVVKAIAKHKAGLHRDAGVRSMKSILLDEEKIHVKEYVFLFANVQCLGRPWPW